ncbi:50S ribosomal protein L19 [Candidatus Daviesbacteria bacterium RIFCSPHIGHO2_02_FULL_36_13]|uniref:50S ribosomal protein L19 n=1 Tax=Candidatus Daviesbacteria bacterium RIFCSPHIGHO2_02_FULL_36_13 TaxID=1797768 RepID=A0A1F5JSS4_9BACT|nr:MAG: 50S ribosomal protein L19 [Candidatus Daviesbacteria bacterium RIFCSPHIGHO2_02_FULL_36_13]OGE44096.1 MAG: 50S ribosomal protein L19 [Candidatus Daviesbacteria bacterium RIFCSPLOWO2_01_FULL_36_8]
MFVLKSQEMNTLKIGETDVNIGDQIRVHSKVVEGEKSRIQIFEGILIRLKGRADNCTFTVRKIGAGGIGIERIWPVDSRNLVKVEVKKKSSGVRRSKLYYMRNLSGKEAIRA